MYVLKTCLLWPTPAPQPGFRHLQQCHQVMKRFWRACHTNVPHWPNFPRTDALPPDGHISVYLWLQQKPFLTYLVAATKLQEAGLTNPLWEESSSLEKLVEVPPSHSATYKAHSELWILSLAFQCQVAMSCVSMWCLTVLDWALPSFLWYRLYILMVFTKTQGTTLVSALQVLPWGWVAKPCKGHCLNAGTSHQNWKIKIKCRMSSHKEKYRNKIWK